MESLKNIEQKLKQTTITRNAMFKMYHCVRHSPRILLEPNEQDRKKLIEIIQLYDKATNDFQGTWKEETDDEIALRIFALKNIEYTGKLKIAGRAMRDPSERDPYTLTDIVFRYHKAVDNPKTLAIADAMVRIWQSQNYPTKWTGFRSIIEPIMRRHYH